jgi:hypothetical protein
MNFSIAACRLSGLRYNCFSCALPSCLERVTGSRTLWRGHSGPLGVPFLFENVIGQTATILGDGFENPVAEHQIAYLVGVYAVVVNQPVGPNSGQPRIQTAGSQVCLARISHETIEKGCHFMA